MKPKKTLSYFLILIMVSSLCFFKSIPAFADEQPVVKLLYAQAKLINWYGPGTVPYQVHGNIVGAIELKNLAYAKNVVVHYTEDGANWNDIPATYSTSTENNCELWKFETPIQHSEYRGSVYAKFCIKYEVNGVTYWDNNNGKNYSVSAGFGEKPEVIMPGCNVHLTSCNASNHDYLSGVIKVKNLAPIKDVKVRYSTDNWNSYKEVSASYQDRYSSYNKDFGLEDWTFEIPNRYDIKFAVSYTVNGVTYWDNNLGSNYSFN